MERVGIGTDIHRLEPGGPLRLGGIDIPFDQRLSGHSDGDVVLHAVTDAILGAACLPDIGERFPDDDPAYKGADSRLFLRDVVEEIASRGYVVLSVDVVIHAERPKLTEYKRAIRGCVADLVGLRGDRVSIKAKTNEGLDAVGRGEAIACTSVVGLGRRDDVSHSLR
ncbi:MAG: 2-C-methyl-D-erythritol 2,4-cyclodiphosphate synthase [Phycisphaerae bacterium]|nr:2-C-methyl-D-erythritol 2,4-cyclodiphosphate synthase [Phycisphaerae bacterium]